MMNMLFRVYQDFSVFCFLLFPAGFWHAVSPAILLLNVSPLTTKAFSLTYNSLVKFLSVQSTPLSTKIAINSVKCVFEIYIAYYGYFLNFFHTLLSMLLLHHVYHILSWCQIDLVQEKSPANITILSLLVLELSN